ncbi:nuclear transport factor 2 family protein [Ideonella sp. A 288]|uniref:nuclear transport factor 2 family protein n=1 Tax=Ideonella sp. A 288 TaxID=1962181 RepID=UPI000B4B4AF8|nr:nuclear transport factor 2 family protein [Ideonella sp. A 288]
MTTDLAPQDLASTWSAYSAAWQAGSPAERQALFTQALHADCRYEDPLTQAVGWPALSAYMQDLQRQIPGVHFVVQRFRAHHRRSAAEWQMRDGQNHVLGDGVSFGEYAPDGKLLRMTGFFDLPPAA